MDVKWFMKTTQQSGETMAQFADRLERLSKRTEGLLEQHDNTVYSKPALVRSAHELRDNYIISSLAHKYRIILEEEEDLMYFYCNLTLISRLIQANVYGDETESCVIFTTHRLIKLDAGMVSLVLRLKDMTSVTPQHSHMFSAYDYLVIAMKTGDIVRVGFRHGDVCTFMLEKCNQVLAGTLSVDPRDLGQITLPKTLGQWVVKKRREYADQEQKEKACFLCPSLQTAAAPSGVRYGRGLLSYNILANLELKQRFQRIPKETIVYSYYTGRLPVVCVFDETVCCVVLTTHRFIRIEADQLAQEVRLADMVAVHGLHHGRLQPSEIVLVTTYGTVSINVLGAEVCDFFRKILKQNTAEYFARAIAG